MEILSFLEIFDKNVDMIKTEFQEDLFSKGTFWKKKVFLMKKIQKSKAMMIIKLFVKCGKAFGKILGRSINKYLAKTL